MDTKDCFGSIRETLLNNGQTMTQSRSECRNCEVIRDCLRTSKQIEEENKEKDELRRQNLIANIIDLSHITSNEIASCLLEFLSRIYSSPLGMIFFKNFLLFCEVPQNSSSFSLTLPISHTTMELILGEESESENPKEAFTLRIILLQKSFPNQTKANMGMVACEVARAFASDDLGIKQVLQPLSESDRSLFKKMSAERRTNWLIEKWGFLDEFEAFKKETAVEK